MTCAGHDMIKEKSALADFFVSGVKARFYGFNVCLNGIVIAVDLSDFVFRFKFRLHSGFAKNAFERIDLVLNVVAELEGWDQAFVDEDGFAGARITRRTRLARLARKRAETANFNSIAFDKLLAEQIEELFDDNFNIIAHKSGGFSDFLNKELFSYISHALNISLS